MHVDEAHARMLNAQRQAEAATATPSDAASLAVVRQAQMDLAREKERRFMDQAELFELFDTRDPNDEVFHRLRRLNLICVRERTIPGSYWLGTPDTQELWAPRHDYDYWDENFLFVAARRGLKKTR